MYVYMYIVRTDTVMLQHFTTITDSARRYANIDYIAE